MIEPSWRAMCRSSANERCSSRCRRSARGCAHRRVRARTPENSLSLERRSCRRRAGTPSLRQRSLQGRGRPHMKPPSRSPIAARLRRNARGRRLIMRDTRESSLTTAATEANLVIRSPFAVSHALSLRSGWASPPPGFAEGLESQGWRRRESNPRKIPASRDPSRRGYPLRATPVRNEASSRRPLLVGKAITPAASCARSSCVISPQLVTGVPVV